MARISPKNPRFRTREEICQDLSFILNCKQLQWGTKFAVLDQVLWVWTEFDGKHAGCKYWSKKALATRSTRVGLIHEHLIPRKVVSKKITDLKNPTPREIREILDHWCVGVVVTMEEDERLKDLGLRSNMPDEWDEKDILARYKLAEIEVEGLQSRREDA